MVVIDSAITRDPKLDVGHLCEFREVGCQTSQFNSAIGAYIESVIIGIAGNKAQPKMGLGRNAIEYGLLTFWIRAASFLLNPCCERT